MTALTSSSQRSTQSTLKVELPPKLHNVFVGSADVRGAFGGRGSGKSRSFALMAAIWGARWDQEGREGVIVCARQHMNSLDDSSMAEVKQAIRSVPWLMERYDIGEKFIRSKSGKIRFLFMGLSENLGSIKSTARILLCWVDEAEAITERAWDVLLPTIREEDSELWVTWNPELEDSPTDKRFRKSSDDLMKVVQMNWRDNPWFPSKLDRERRKCKEQTPWKYDWIWEGAYLVAHEGAYFSSYLQEAQRTNRIRVITPDPLMMIKSYHDIGGAGKVSDDYAIWVVQFINAEIRILDHYASQGQSLSFHAAWLRDRGWSRAQIILPHDGLRTADTEGKTYEDHWREAGFTSVTTIPNQGRGASKQRVEAAWRWFPRMFFNEETTRIGRKSLAWYHEKIDNRNNRGARLGPDHDWSCFVGETEVLTRYGTCQIKNLPATGEVLTPCGWKPYRNPRVTRRSAPLVAVTFADGLTVNCTADHLFMTASGWISALSLRRGMQIQSSLTPSRSTSMADSTGCGRASGISLVAVSAFIGKFGRQFSGQCRQAVTSITGMRTSFTTRSRIWNAFHLQSTWQNLALIPKGLAGPLVMARQIGIAPKRGAFGTVETPSDRRVGQSGSAVTANAINAEKHTALSFVRMLLRSASATRPAKWPITENADWRTNMPLRIASVKRLRTRSDVWCLTVPEAECFSLSNGAVVHNCHDADAFGLMAVDYKEPLGMTQLSIPVPAQGNA